MKIGAETQESKGFTLIELLVTVGIFSLLSSVVLTSVSASRTRAVNAKFAAELQDLKKGLTSWYLDKGYFPNCHGQSGCQMNDIGTQGGIEAVLQPLIAEGYVQRVPHYPTGTTLGALFFPNVPLLYEPAQVFYSGSTPYDAAVTCKEISYAQWQPSDTHGAILPVNYSGQPISGLSNSYTLCTAMPGFENCITYEGPCMEFTDL